MSAEVCLTLGCSQGRGQASRQWVLLAASVCAAHKPHQHGVLLRGQSGHLHSQDTGCTRDHVCRAVSTLPHSQSPQAACHQAEKGQEEEIKAATP